jgi:FkbM family methyltransferase
VPTPARNAPPAPPEPLPAEVSGIDVQRELVRSPEPVVFDVGAHVGSMAGEYLRRMPGAFVHCFEPNPAAYEELRRNLAGNPRVAFHSIALAGSVGRASLHVNAFGPTSSLLASDERGASYWGEGLLDTRRTMEVGTTTLDAFCAAKGIERIDVLKLDVQGAELSVLEGARRMLTEQRIALVYFEMILAPTYRGQAGLDAYMNLLTAHDYRLFGLYAPMYKRRRLIQADLLFVGSRCLAEYEADAT